MQNLPENNVQTLIENSSLYLILKHIFNPQNAANIFLSAFVTTVATGLIKIPGEKINLYLSNSSQTNQSFNFRSAFAFASLRYLPAYIGHTLPKSTYVVASKNSPKPKDEKFEESANFDIKQILNKLAHTSNIALIETKLSNYSDQKLALTQRPNPPSFSSHMINHMHVFRGNFGISYLVSLLNLSALTHLADYYQKTIFGTSLASSSYEAMLVGALSGVTSVFLTYPLKEIKNDTILGAYVLDDQLKYPSLRSVIKAQFNHMLVTSLNDLCQTFLKKLSTRSIQCSLLFSTIITINHLLGPTPADDLSRHVDQLCK